MLLETASIFANLSREIPAMPVNKEVHNAYLTICSQCGSLTVPDPNRAYNKFVQISKAIEPDAITAPNIIQEFYTPVCSVKLVCEHSQYYIVLTITDQHLNRGHSDKSNNMLRIAFTATDSRDKRHLASKLQIRIDNNIEAVYRHEFDKRIDRENIKYLQKRGIKV